MWQKFLIDIYTVLFPLAIGYIIKLLKQSNKERNAVYEGMVQLLQIKLIEYHDQYCPTGKVPSYVYDNFCSIYNSYMKLDKENGMIIKMKKEFDMLTIGKDDFNAKRN